jgi:hypothetical protein
MNGILPGEMRLRSFLAAALLAIAATTACQPTPGGGGESQPAPSEAAPSSEAAGPSETPRENPNY